MLIFSQLQQSHRILLFNSQSLKETDQYCVYYGITKKAFQHSRRLAIMPQVRFLPSWYFNSQPHKEADDLEASVFCPACDISTHSLTRRLTQVCKWSKQADCISTHSLTRRLTAIIVQHPAFPKNFNSQPHKEADIFSNASFSLFAYFNSQPHKEADCCSVNKQLHFVPFQLTASQGG